jgi:16S rRNA (guanine527-N7)-methyltransferase
MGKLDTALSELGARYDLSGGQVKQLAGLMRALSADELAPTTVTMPEHAVDVHVADSLVALELAAVSEAGRIVDIGSGTGFPGLALAVALSTCAVALVESHARKCEFIERMAGAAGIDNAAVVCVRAEQWPQGRDVHDVALARAVAPQPVVLEYAAPLLRVGGVLVDWRARRDSAEEAASLQAAAELGLERLQIQRVQPFVAARDRHLHTFLKSGETPARFPRRAGLARKRPLTGRR